MTTEEIKTIRNAIRDKRFQWSSGRTSLTELNHEERKMYLGFIADEEEMVRTEARIIEEDVGAAAEGKAFVYPEEWDWRNVRGRDWTTPVKDQGLCMSCVAFATVALIESAYEISKRRPYLNPDLSEADLFFCSGKRCGRGWTFKPALEYVKEKGIPDEACFPYKPKDQPCKPCADREKKLVKIEKWKELYSESEVKEWIYRNSPVITAMKVYTDFYSYRGGIYRNAWGEKEGYHAVTLIGYHDRRRYWICKNSWGTSWGEKGWFRIAYGECEIGKRFPFYAVEFGE